MEWIGHFSFDLVFLFVIFCVVLYLIFRKKQDKKKVAKYSVQIPGFEPISLKLGNYPQIDEAGSLHLFLSRLHKRYGPVAHFWLGPTYVVSTAHPTALKSQMHLFDRPCQLFENLRPLIGDESIQFKNGEEGRHLRHLFDQPFSHHACEAYLPKLIEEAERTANDWEESSEEEIDLRKSMLALALRGLMHCCFGEYFNNDESCLHFQENYDIAFSFLEGRMKDPEMELKESFFTAAEEMKKQVWEMIEDRIEGRNLEEGQLLIDEIILAADNNKEFAINMTLTYIIAGFHTTGTLMTWMLHYLTLHPDCQEKMRQELNELLGDDEIYPDALEELLYSRKCIEEAMRLSVLAPYAARFSPKDEIICGYLVPKNTPILHALGVVLQDERLWHNHNEFDPSRFDDLASHADTDVRCPFFGVGKRKCPGHRFAYAEVLTFSSVLLRGFRLEAGTGESEVGREYGFVTHPDRPIWIRPIVIEA